MQTCLTLILPRALEEQVVDHLLSHPEGIGRFIAHPADGHGSHGPSIAEQVRGRSARVRIDVLLEDSRQAEQVIARLGCELRGADVAWWLTPVSASGSFA